MDKQESEIDEKVARLIEETEKSLRSMEQTLGPEHPVVGKLLDSYAKILRQNNVRLLDAVNMEARAKAIRAKHNKTAAAKHEAEVPLEAEGRTKGKAKTFSPTQLKFVGWIVAGIVISVMVLSVQKLMSSTAPVLEKADAKKTSDSAPDTHSYSVESVELKDSNGDVVKTLEVKRKDELSVMEYAKGLMHLKRKIVELRKEAHQKEKSGDYDGALDLYQDAVLRSQAGEVELGRRLINKDVVEAYEGYARMLRLQGKPEDADFYDGIGLKLKKEVGKAP